ncbi:MAG: hypothetical protein CMH56_10170 [Myxococcales bacterium]|nr:hypothetical protein [Myxococcales bacterium]
MKVATSHSLQPFVDWLRQAHVVPQTSLLESEGHSALRSSLRFRECLEDFQVEEQLAFVPAAQGHHLFCFVEKQGLSTNHLVQRISERWGISKKNIGFAGRKDQRGVTRQWVSLPAQHWGAEDPSDLGIDGVRLLEVVRNNKKLRLGQLTQNRFRVLLRGEVSDPEGCKARWKRAVSQGIPNFFGHQRFGYGQGNLEKVVAFLKRGKRARSNKEKFLESVFQSICFNQWLGQRIAQQALPQALSGDILLGLPFGLRPFPLENEADTQERIASGAITVAGPLLGPKSMAATDEAQRFESDVWTQMGLQEAWLTQTSVLSHGARRPAMVPLIDPSWTDVTDGLLLEFGLPKGSYATVVLDHLFPGQIEDFAKADLSAP